MIRFFLNRASAQEGYRTDTDTESRLDRAEAGQTGASEGSRQAARPAAASTTPIRQGMILEARIASIRDGLIFLDIGSGPHLKARPQSGDQTGIKDLIPGASVRLKVLSAKGAGSPALVQLLEDSDAPVPKGELRVAREALTLRTQARILIQKLGQGPTFRGLGGSIAGETEGAAEKTASGQGPYRFRNGGAGPESSGQAVSRETALSMGPLSVKGQERPLLSAISLPPAPTAVDVAQNGALFSGKGGGADLVWALLRMASRTQTPRKEQGLSGSVLPDGSKPDGSKDAAFSRPADKGPFWGPRGGLATGGLQGSALDSTFEEGPITPLSKAGSLGMLKGSGSEATEGSKEGSHIEKVPSPSVSRVFQDLLHGLSGARKDGGPFEEAGSAGSSSGSSAGLGGASEVRPSVFRQTILERVFSFFEGAGNAPGAKEEASGDQPGQVWGAGAEKASVSGGREPEGGHAKHVRTGLHDSPSDTRPVPSSLRGPLVKESDGGEPGGNRVLEGAGPAAGLHESDRSAPLSDVVIRMASGFVEATTHLQSLARHELGINLLLFPLFLANSTGVGNWAYWEEKGHDSDGDGEGPSVVSHIAFDLNMSGLGLLKIHVASKDQGLDLTVGAEGRSVALVRRELPLLVERLKASGFRFSAIDIFSIEECGADPFLAPGQTRLPASGSLDILA